MIGRQIVFVVARLRGVIAAEWQGPRDLPRSLTMEWRLIAARWVGMIVVAPALPLLGLPIERLIGAYAILLFAVAYNFAQERGTQAITGQRSRVLVSIGMASLTLSGLYIVNLLSGFMALFLSVGSISADVDSGTLHALLARPMKRSHLLLAA